MIYRVLKSSIRYRLQPTNELQKAKQNLTTPVGCYLAINVKPRQASLQRSHAQKKLPHSFSVAAAKRNSYNGVLSFEQCSFFGTYLCFNIGTKICACTVVLILVGISYF